MAQYTHLSQEERYTIKALLGSGYTQAAIARELNRHKSTISREIKRNTGKKGYRPKQAQQLYESRRYKHLSFITEFATAFIKYLLSCKWSPAQIHHGLTNSGWLGVPCHEWIYQWVYALKRQGDKTYQHLRCQKKYRKRGLVNNDRRGQITDRQSIHDRPQEANTCKRIGHYEGDTIVGAKHKGAILTLVDRSSMYLMTAALNSKNANETMQACKQLLVPACALTVTFDNGKEFSAHRLLKPMVSVYFADAYCSNQRAKNENTNRLLRQYFGKKTSLLNIDKAELQRCTDEINNRPRKNLGWLSPNQVLLNPKVVALGY